MNQFYIMEEYCHFKYLKKYIEMQDKTLNPNLTEKLNKLKTFLFELYASIIQISMTLRTMV